MAAAATGAGAACGNGAGAAIGANAGTARMGNNLLGAYNTNGSEGGVVGSLFVVEAEL